MQIDTVIAVNIILLLVFGAAAMIYMLLQVSRRSPSDTPSMKTGLTGYAYIVTFVSILALVFGSVILVNVIFSYAVGFDFSYDVSSYYGGKFESSTVHITSSSGEVFYGNKTDIQDSLYASVSIIVPSLVMLLVHLAILYSMRKAKDSVAEKISLSFYLLGAIMGGLTLALATPAALYSTIHYFSSNNTYYTSYSIDLAGPLLATVIIVFPLWIFFVFKLFLHYRKDG